MALIPSVTYSGQVLTNDPGAYPYGKAKNKVSEDDKTGTPWEEQGVNDIWGFLQALLIAGGVTPNGAPDEVGASNYLSALQQVASDVSHVVLDADIAANAVAIALLQNIAAERVPTEWLAPLVMQTNLSSRFEYLTTGAYGITTLYQASVTNAGKVTIPISIPFPVCKIAANGVTVYAQGGTVHSSLPATKPQVTVSVKPLGGASSNLAQGYDLSTSTAAYEAVHPITPTMSERTMQPTDTLAVMIEGEADADAIIGLQIHAIRLNLLTV